MENEIVDIRDFVKVYGLICFGLGLWSFDRVLKMRGTFFVFVGNTVQAAGAIP